MVNKNKDICTKHRCVCIAVCLNIVSVILVVTCIYKYDLWSFIKVIFQEKFEGVWNVLDVVASTVVGILTVTISSKLSKVQARQSNMEIKQNQLTTEPHILVDNIEVMSAEGELSADKTKFKTINGVDFPYYINIQDNVDLLDSVLIVVSFVNTSEAFARVRFNKLVFKDPEENIIGEYSISTVGVNKNHVMLPKGKSGKIGFVINRNLLSKLEGTRFSISTFLDNNFNECFKDIQNYYISAICEEKVSFMVCDVKENLFEKIC